MIVQPRHRREFGRTFDRGTPASKTTRPSPRIPSLSRSREADLTPGGNAADSRWFTVSGDRVQQELAFDHAVLLKAAVARLRAKVEYTSLPVFLMSDEFTLTELQHTYEILLSRQLEKKAFRTRLLAAGLLDPVPRMKIGSNRPAQLYRSKRRRRPHMFSRPFGSAQPSPV